VQLRLQVPRQQHREKEAIRPRINEEIRVGEVHLIDTDGANRGTIPTAEAIRLAQEAGLDLVEISPGAVPPVCKLTVRRPTARRLPHVH
jgi:translation initiation factor IF-3